MARMKPLAVLFSRNLLKIKNGLDELVRKENLSGVLVHNCTLYTVIRPLAS